MRTHHWFDFEMTIECRGANKSVRIEATVSSNGNGIKIEGFKVKLLDSTVEMVPSDAQVTAIKAEIVRRCTSA
jgi:hypothetical protein